MADGSKGKIKFLGISLGGSTMTVSDRSSDWLNSSKTLTDQLRELNEETSSHVTWSVEGKRVVPRSFNVAKLTASSLSKSLTFSHVKRRYTEAPFSRRTALYLKRSQVPRSEIQDLKVALAGIKTQQEAKGAELDHLKAQQEVKGVELEWLKATWKHSKVL
jgi:hypothetical protein